MDKISKKIRAFQVQSWRAYLVGGVSMNKATYQKKLSVWMEKYLIYTLSFYLSTLEEELHFLGMEVTDYFYDDYDPKSYLRSGALYGAFKITVMNVDGKGWVDVDVSPEYMKANYHDPTDYVFNGAYELGIHGTSKIKVTSPNPLEYFDNLCMERFGDDRVLLMWKEAKHKAKRIVGPPPVWKE